MSIKAKLLIMLAAVDLILGSYLGMLLINAHTCKELLGSLSLRFQKLEAAVQTCSGFGESLSEIDRNLAGAGKAPGKANQPFAENIRKNLAFWQELEKKDTSGKNLPNEHLVLIEYLNGALNILSSANQKTVEIPANSAGRKTAESIEKEIHRAVESAISKIEQSISSQIQEMDINCNRLLLKSGIMPWVVNSIEKEIDICRVVPVYYKNVAFVRINLGRELEVSRQLVILDEEFNDVEYLEHVGRTKWSLRDLKNTIDAEIKLGHDIPGEKEDLKKVLQLTEDNGTVSMLIDKAYGLKRKGGEAESIKMLDADLLSLVESSMIPVLDDLSEDSIAELHEAFRGLYKRITFATILSVIAIALLALFLNIFIWHSLIKGILASLGRIRDGAEIIKTIQLDHRIGLKTKDELGDLARSFDVMAEALQKSMDAGLSLTEYTNNVLGSMNDALLVLSARDGRIEKSNKAASSLIGYNEDELSEKFVGNIFFIRSVTGENVLIDKIRKEPLKNAELECVTKSGRKIPVIFSSSFVKDKRGNSQGIVCIVKDISDIKTAQKALKENEEKFRTIIEHSNDLIWMLDKNGNFTYFNKQAEQTSGYRLSEYLGKSFELMIFVEDIPRVKRIFFETLSGKSAHYDVNIVSKDGGIVSLSVNTAPFFESGEIVGAVSFGQDITERENAQKALKESEERYKTIIANTLDIIYTCNPDGIVTFVSSTATALAGYLPEEIIGRNLLEFMHPEDVPKALENLTKALMSETSELPANVYRLRKKDGTYVYTEEVSKVIRKGGKIVQLNGVIRDISERKRLEAQLTQSQRLEVIGRLAGGIAHDFNNLMTAILGYTSLIISRVTGDEQMKDDLTEIKKAGERAASLTKQLLAFSRKQMIRTESMNLNSLLSDMDKILRRIIGEDNQLSLLLEPALKSIEIDPVQFEQVVMNFVINSCDAMPKGGKISIKTENVEIGGESFKDIEDARPGEFISVAFSDTGIGMSQNVLDHLFEPFFTTKEVGKGTGLGLAMVYGIIKQHLGWITVQSKVGEGSEFKVYLPVASGKDTPRRLEKAEAVLPDSYRSNGERILLIEDEGIVRRYVSRVLSQSGYKIFEAKDAGEAMKIFLAENGDFHLIFSDIILPDKNGIDLVQELPLKNPKTKVIFSSGYSDDKSQSEIVLQAGVHFLHKPYKAFELLVAVRNLLDSDKA